MGTCEPHELVKLAKDLQPAVPRVCHIPLRQYCLCRTPQCRAPVHP